MSSDLWKEFAASSQEVLENPWAEHSSPEGNNQVYSQSIPSASVPTRSPISLANNLTLRPGEVLFDAADEFPGENDDFGDFEGPQETISTLEILHKMQTPPTKQPSNNSMHTEQEASASKIRVGSRSAITQPSQEYNPFADLAILTKTPVTSINQEERESPITAWPSYERSDLPFSKGPPIPERPEDDDWGDFIESSDLPTNNVTDDEYIHDFLQNLNGSDPPPQKSPSPSVGPSQLLDIFEEAQSPMSLLSHQQREPPQKTERNSKSMRPTPMTQQSLTATKSPHINQEETLFAATSKTTNTPTSFQGVLPTNIPPPSILLPLIPTLLTSLSTNIRRTLPPYAPSSASQFAPPKEITDQVQSHLSTTLVAARLIAGRKLRWKRDTRLSQSMKIGPAHAGKASGMKLTGVDKAESRREDREVEEVLRAWKSQLGPLRATIITVNTRLPGAAVTVPEIAENMPVRVAQACEGAITAPTCCLLCGLRRDERIDKVDGRVEDSFGEWWTEYWGHVGCRAFWEEHESSLQQR
ncbi:hypothetical protein MMC12_007660 [Toensbergia leucococca]|nr:hypothetical protein [Toensbergia leucococca]